MKYLTGILLVLLMQAATAGQCRVDGGPWIDVYFGSITVTTPVRATPGSGRIQLDGYRLECRYKPDNSTPTYAKDFWYTYSDALKPGPKFTRYRTGLSIHGRDYPVPVSGNVSLATMPDNGQGVNLETYMFIDTQGTPGSPIDIREGDLLGTLSLLQTNNTPNPSSDVYVYLKAGNNLIVEPSTCTINSNRPLEINFMQVNSSQIGESPGSTGVRKDVRLNYTCPDPGVTLPVTITLKAQASSFNANVLGLSNQNLGAGLLRGNELVAPGQSFRTNIINSVGADNVTFALVRKSGSTPVGAFVGSGSLVMGVP